MKSGKGSLRLRRLRRSHRRRCTVPIGVDGSWCYFFGFTGFFFVPKHSDRSYCLPTSNSMITYRIFTSCSSTAAVSAAAVCSKVSKARAYKGTMAWWWPKCRWIWISKRNNSETKKKWYACVHATPSVDVVCKHFSVGPFSVGFLHHLQNYITPRVGRAERCDCINGTTGGSREVKDCERIISILNEI